MKQSPPHWIENLLEKLIDPTLYNGICGDLYEDYQRNLVKGKRYANIKFFLSALGYLRYFRLLSSGGPSNRGKTIIWGNYLKSSYRNLARHKGNTLISLVGLTVSFTAATAIFLYAEFESSYDQFHHDHEHIYRVTHDFTNAATTTTHAQTFYGVSQALAEDLPEAVHTVPLFSIATTLKREDNEIFVENNVSMTTPEFFDLFKYDMVEGNVNELSEPDVIMLSESAAKKYFGDKSAIGHLRTS